MSTETALPESVNTDAGASEHADNTAAAADNNDQAGADSTDESGAKAKPEKTPEQREIDRLRRAVDRKTRQVYELRSQVPQQQQNQHQPSQADDDEPVTLTRAELQRQIEQQAQKLAPSLSEQNAEAQRRQEVVNALAKDWGADKFDALSSDLDEAFGGLVDRSGKPKPATEAIFYADDPKSVIEYLADPENSDEAERISQMTAVQAGRAVAKLEATLAAQKAQGKPKPSNAPKPIEAARGGGVTQKDPTKMNDAEFAEWRRDQIKKRNA